MTDREESPAFTHGRFRIELWRNQLEPTGLSDLLAEAHRSGYGWVSEFPRDWTAPPFMAAGEALFVAFEADHLVAMAVISADPFVDDPDTGRLRFIYVATEARGEGLARRLLEACLHHGASRWRRLRLHTDNPIAARLYERCGFRSVTGETRTTHARG